LIISIILFSRRKFFEILLYYKALFAKIIVRKVLVWRFDQLHQALW
jgi:hypothetical protein